MFAPENFILTFFIFSKYLLLNRVAHNSNYLDGSPRVSTLRNSVPILVLYQGDNYDL